MEIKTTLNPSHKYVFLENSEWRLSNHQSLVELGKVRFQWYCYDTKLSELIFLNTVKPK